MWRGGILLLQQKKDGTKCQGSNSPFFLFSFFLFEYFWIFAPNTTIFAYSFATLFFFLASTWPFLALARSNNILLCAILVRGVWQESVLGHVAIEDVTGWETTSCIEFRHRWLSCKIMFSFSSILPGVAGSTWNKGKIHLCKKSSWTCLLYLSHFLLCLSFIYIGHQQFTISQEPC